MSIRTSFTKLGSLYNKKPTIVSNNPQQLSQFAKLGNNTVEGVRDVMVKRKKEDLDKPEKITPKVQPKSSVEQFNRVQSLYKAKFHK